MKNIQLAINIAGIGDLVLASKSLRALKTSHPDTELWLMTSSEASKLAMHFPYIDHVIPFPIRELRGNRRQLLVIWKIVNTLRQIPFCRILNLYLIGSYVGALKMGLLFSLLNSGLKCGHDAFGFGHFLTKRVPADTFMKQHYADAMCDIAELTGAKRDQGGLDIFWDRSCEEKWRRHFADAHDRILIGINPGGDRPNRRWNPDYFCDVALNLQKQYRPTFFLLGGPGEEFLAKKIGDQISSSSVINLAGRLSLHDLCFIISKLHLLITNDSGPMHIAAATQTPVVAIFGPEKPVNLRPYTDEKLYRVLYRDLPCRPCGNAECSEPLCLSAIKPEEVFASCKALIDTTMNIGFDG